MNATFVTCAVMVFAALLSVDGARADITCRVDLSIHNAASFGSANLNLHGPSGVAFLDECNQTGPLAVNDREILGPTLDAGVLCSTQLDPIICNPHGGPGYSGDTPLLECCVRAPSVLGTKDFVAILSNLRTLTGATGASATVAVSAVNCQNPPQCAGVSPSTSTTMSGFASSTTSSTTSTSFTTTTLPPGACGDGVRNPGEACDDGNTVWSPGEPCRANCTRTPCGRPTDTPGPRPTTTDALFVLRAALKLQSCAPAVCDIDSSGRVLATDALAVLQHAVGLPVVLACPL